MTDQALILIAPPGSGALRKTAVEHVFLELPQARKSNPRWLAPREAWEVTLRAETQPEVEGLRRVIGLIAGQVLGDLPVDMCLVPTAHRRKLLLVADMDSTIINQECIDEIADVLGIKPQIAAITERAMQGELPFETALKERLHLLKGVSNTQLQEVYDRRIELMPGAATLIATMKKHGAYTALVSGGFTFFTSRVATRVGFDTNRANTLGMASGLMTGTVDGPILGREAKLAALTELTQSRNLEPAQTLAVGDGANDLDMIVAAGLGVAYRAKPVVSAQAHAAINFGDLTALLYLQGYAKSEFVIS
jgi:phosphoserine phosphatase